MVRHMGLHYKRCWIKRDSMTPSNKSDSLQPPKGGGFSPTLLIMPNEIDNEIIDFTMVNDLAHLSFIDKLKYKGKVERMSKALDKENVSKRDFLLALPSFLSVIYQNASKADLDNYLDGVKEATTVIINQINKK